MNLVEGAVVAVFSATYATSVAMTASCPATHVGANSAETDPVLHRVSDHGLGLNILLGD